MVLGCSYASTLERRFGRGLRHRLGRALVHCRRICAHLGLRLVRFSRALNLLRLWDETIGAGIGMRSGPGLERRLAVHWSVAVHAGGAATVLRWCSSGDFFVSILFVCIETEKQQEPSRMNRVIKATIQLKGRSLQRRDRFKSNSWELSKNVFLPLHSYRSPWLRCVSISITFFNIKVTVGNNCYISNSSGYRLNQSGSKGLQPRFQTCDSAIKFSAKISRRKLKFKLNWFLPVTIQTAVAPDSDEAEHSS